MASFHLDIGPSKNNRLVLPNLNEHRKTLRHNYQPHLNCIATKKTNSYFKINYTLVPLDVNNGAIPCGHSPNLLIHICSQDSRVEKRFGVPPQPLKLKK